MASIIHSAAPYGFHTSRVEVEVDVAQGMPQFTIGGLGDTAIHESKERIRSAIKNSGYKFPDGRVTVNLAPASSRKEGASLDCAIALGILTEMGVISPVSSDIVVLGELALNGSVRPIQGAIRIALDLVKHHPGTFIIPESNFLEVRVVEGLTYIPVRTLGDILSALQPDSKLERVMGSRAFLASAPSQSTISVRLEDIAGHEQAKRALMIAAAGNHHLLLYGPPGAGKSILAQALPSILPEMTEEEIMETTEVYSIAGKLDPASPLMIERPFRAPHHTATTAAMIGGGTPPGPGEISLAHHGVLFLDEVLEFPRSVIEALREPLESHRITISRSQSSSTFPAAILFVGAFNPCPCGYATDPDHECLCTAYQRLQYQKRLSGPIRDRCDLFLHVERTDLSSGLDQGKTSAEAREQCIQARKRQTERFRECAFHWNSEIPHRFLIQHLSMTDAARSTAQTATRRLHLSPRSYLKLLRTAQTIADLECAETLTEDHVLEALQFRIMNLMG